MVKLHSKLLLVYLHFELEVIKNWSQFQILWSLEILEQSKQFNLHLQVYQLRILKTRIEILNLMMRMKILSLILRKILVQLKEVQDLHNNQVISSPLVFLLMSSMKLIKFAEQFPKNILYVGSLQLPLVTLYLFQMKMTKEQCLKSWKRKTLLLTKCDPSHLLGCGNELDATFLRREYLSLF
jgi:hypothetical protein